MNFTAGTLPVLQPDPLRSSRTRARCRTSLEQRRKRTPPLVGVLALGGVGVVYLAAIILDVLRLYSSRSVN